MKRAKVTKRVGWIKMFNSIGICWGQLDHILQTSRFNLVLIESNLNFGFVLGIAEKMNEKSVEQSEWMNG